MRKKTLAALVAAFLWFTPDMRADQLTLTTALPVGSDITLALEANIKATLEWGDGTTEEVTFNGMPQTFKVADAELVIKTEQTITQADVSSCGLTALNLLGARNLKVLNCADNQLTTLSLTRSEALTELDCENNELTALAQLYKCTEIKNLNCAGNKLTELSTTGMTKLETLVCNDNQLTKLDLSRQTQLKALWCQGNQLSELDLDSKPALTSVLASGNQLEQVGLADATRLATLWVDNNRLAELDLRTATLVSYLSADHNQLTSIRMMTRPKNPFTHFYAHNNQLTYKSFPTVYKSGKVEITSALDEQAPIALDEVVFEGESVDFNTLIASNAWNVATKPTVTWKYKETGETVNSEDYKMVNYGKYTFPKQLGLIYAEISTDSYPGVMLQTSVINVASPTGINDAAETTATWSTAKGTLTLNTQKPVKVAVYNMQGIRMVSADVKAGTHTWNLPCGTYIVNGTKLLIP